MSCCCSQTVCRTATMVETGLQSLRGSGSARVHLPPYLPSVLVELLETPSMQSRRLQRPCTRTWARPSPTSALGSPTCVTW